MCLECCVRISCLLFASFLFAITIAILWLWLPLLLMFRGCDHHCYCYFVVTIVIATPWSPLLLMLHGCGCCSMVMVVITTTISWLWLSSLLFLRCFCHHCCLFQGHGHPRCYFLLLKQGVSSPFWLCAGVGCQMWSMNWPQLQLHSPR